MKLAALDIGSNSIHLIIVEIFPDGNYRVIDKARDMVGLAKNTLSSGYLSDKEMSKGLACLRRMRGLCESRKVDVAHAVATSAVRSAVNGEHFVQRVRDEVGFDIEVISGDEEARLIYLGARDNIDWINRKALLVDIGGGSVEFVVGDASQAYTTVSLELGVRRLSERFLAEDPPTNSNLKALKRYILEQLAPLPAALAEAPAFDFVVGTSGTLKALATVAARRTGADPDSSHGQWTLEQDLKEMARALSGLRRDERTMYYDIDPKRRDTIVAGAQLMKYILRTVGQECYIACDYSLRDGLVVDFIERYCRDLTEADMAPQVRRRSVRRMYGKFNRSGAHPQDVAKIALSLFDDLAPLHGLGPRDREDLENVALLHDIGAIIDPKDRHLHSAYLLRTAEGLHGFSAEERDEMARIAQLVRYPRKDLQSEEFKALPEQRRMRIVWLAGLLRLADGLDRSRTSNVRRVTTRIDTDGVYLDVKVHANTGLEATAMEYKRDLIEVQLGRPITIEFSN